MTLRASTLLFHPPPFMPPPKDAPREDHLAALAALALRHLEEAMRDGRRQSLQAAARLLLHCHEMQNRWQQYRDKAGPTPAQQAADREWELDRQATANMLCARPDILAVFTTFRQQLDGRDYSGGS